MGMIILPLPVETVAERRTRKTAKRQERKEHIRRAIAAEERFAARLNRWADKINASSARIRTGFKNK